jgi:hypothetical protein
VIVLAAAALPATAAFAGAPADSTRGNPSIAVYGDRLIDLRVSWEDAMACTSDGSSTYCFATEAEMDAFLDARGAPVGLDASIRIGVFVALSSCSASLRLSSGTSYSGSLLHLSTRFVFHNLSAFGFDNITSSYRVGACASVFYDGAGGGGAVYPGATWAWAQSPTMSAGWADRVTSVYIV